MLVIQKLALEVFDRTFRCSLKPVHKRHILSEQGELGILDLAQVSEGTSLDGVSMRRSSSNEDYIRAMFTRQNHLSDEELDETTKDVNLHAPMEYGTTINDMVELWATFRRICFVDYKDILTVYDTLDAYIRAIEDFSIHSKNYRGVTDEEMDKMRTLLSALEDKAEGLTVLGVKGESSFQNFMENTGLSGGNFGNIPDGGRLVSSRQRRLEALREDSHVESKPVEESTHSAVSTAGDPFKFLRNGRN